MSIKLKIQEDVKSAMKSQDKQKLSLLRTLHASIKQVEIDTRTDLDEAQIVAVLQKEIKKRREALDFARQACREDLVQENTLEISLIQSYLGEQLSEEQLRNIISGYVSSGFDAIGKIMGQLNKEHKGKFEGKMASSIAQDFLK